MTAMLLRLINNYISLVTSNLVLMLSVAWLRDKLHAKGALD